MADQTIREAVKDYYGKQLQASSDLKTNACCASGAPPKHIRQILSTIHPDILDKFYGCGLVCPPNVEGLTVLDLGCGYETFIFDFGAYGWTPLPFFFSTGRDCYILSSLVGSKGRVIGVDMTDEQLAVATKYIEYHTKQFGYPVR